MPAAATPDLDRARAAALTRWLDGVAPRHGIDPRSLAAASSDASFRRYWRVAADHDAAASTWIVMDAPPPHEDVRPFVRMAALLRDAGLNAPRVLEADVDRGFLLLTDLGTRVYLDELRAADAAGADALMRDAFAALVRLQRGVPPSALPRCDAAMLHTELDLFATWCIEREFGIAWDDADRARWATVCERLVASALAQPVVAVHADWMPRNLMRCDGEANPGVLDFQDAFAGPIGHDVASLLRDAFVSWDEEREIDWTVRWWQHARAAGLPVDADFGEVWRQVEWIGLWRHLRVMGIFCRLKHRDAKPAYAADLPRFAAYATKVAARYAPLAPLLPLLAPLPAAAVRTGYTF